MAVGQPQTGGAAVPAQYGKAKRKPKKGRQDGKQAK
jgi:hypothetical protein